MIWIFFNEYFQGSESISLSMSVFMNQCHTDCCVQIWKYEFMSQLVTVVCCTPVKGFLGKNRYEKVSLFKKINKNKLKVEWVQEKKVSVPFEMY